MSKSEQRVNPTFYLDECLGGNKVYSALKEAGVNVEVHTSHFPRGTPDEEWLPVIGKNGWVLLTQDKQIRKRKNEIQALRENDVQAFVIAAKGLRGEEIGALIVKVMPQILRLLKNTLPPTIGLINQNGIVELKEGSRKFGRNRDQR